MGKDEQQIQKRNSDTVQQVRMARMMHLHGQGKAMAAQGNGQDIA